MIKNEKLAKSIADAAWSAFVQPLCAKAGEAERQIVRANPAYTLQTCSACGYRQDMPLSVRMDECKQCTFIADCDHNASMNILAQAVGSRHMPKRCCTFTIFASRVGVSGRRPSGLSWLSPCPATTRFMVLGADRPCAMRWAARALIIAVANDEPHQSAQPDIFCSPPGNVGEI